MTVIQRVLSVPPCSNSDVVTTRNLRAIARDHQQKARPAATFGLAIPILTASRRATGNRDPRTHGGATFCRIDPTPVFS